MVKLLRKSISRHLYKVPGGYEVIHRGTSAVSVRTLIVDYSHGGRPVRQFGDPVWLPLGGLYRVLGVLPPVEVPEEVI